MGTASGGTRCVPFFPLGHLTFWGQGTNIRLVGLVKAQYTVAYFTEMGIGCRRDILEANVWYVKAAEAGDERASQRLGAIRAAASGGRPMDVAPPKNPALKKKNQSKDKDENCVVM